MSGTTDVSTLRPWHLNGNGAWADSCKDRGLVFECSLRTGTHIPENQNEVNAALIVRAVNSHDDMVAVIKDFLTITESRWRSQPSDSFEKKTMDSARAALAKANTLTNAPR